MLGKSKPPEKPTPGESLETFQAALQDAVAAARANHVHARVIINTLRDTTDTVAMAYATTAAI